MDATVSGQGPMAGSCEHGNEPLDSIKGKEFHDYLRIISFSRWNLLHEVSKYQ
jgi:hypothetical protein